MTGTGIVSDPYIILTRSDLESIITLDHEAYYALGADIDLAGSDWLSLGWNATYDPNGDYEYFDGSFDGGHHKISNMSVHATGNDIQDIGLFNFIYGDSTGLGIVKDLAICNATVHVTTAVTTIEVGLLAGGCSNATISGVTVSGTIILDGVGSVDKVGGLLGFVLGTSTIENCYVNATIDKPEVRADGQTATVLSLSNCGGVTGKTQQDSVTIEDCVVSVTLTNSDPDLWYGQHCLFDSLAFGGIVGLASTTTVVSGCKVTVSCWTSSFNSMLSGGLIAYATAAASFTDCSVSGRVSLPTAGGFAARGKYVTCVRCGADVQITGSNIGGAIGDGNGTAAECVCTDCWAMGDMRGEDIGGFIGHGEGTFTRCYATGLIDHSSWNYYGGFAGTNAPVSATTTDCYWDTDTSGVSTSQAGTGKTTAEMQDVDTFTGWNFSTTWNIASGTYPFLRTVFVSVTNGCASVVHSFPWIGKFQLSHVTA